MKGPTTPISNAASIAWVFAQMLLLAPLAIIAPWRRGHWPPALSFGLGVVLMLYAAWTGLSGVRHLGRNRTPLPEPRAIAVERQADAFADLFPDHRGRDGLAGKVRAPGVGLGLESEHPPEPRAFRVGEIPAQDFGNEREIAPRDGAGKRVAQRDAGPRLEREGELGEGFAHGMQIGFAGHRWMGKPRRPAAFSGR